MLPGANSLYFDKKPFSISHETDGPQTIVLKKSSSPDPSSLHGVAVNPMDYVFEETDTFPGFADKPQTEDSSLE
jgi:hypothetical protein